MKREDAVAAGVRKVRNARPWTKERLLDGLADILGILAGEHKRKGQTGNAD